MIRLLGLAIASAVLLLAAGCGEDEDDEGTVTGSVLSRERIALPPDAEIRVQLLDVSRQDVPAEVVAEEEQRADGRQVPIPYRLDYPLSTIDERFTYSVSSTISIDGRVVYRSTQVTPVITRGNPTEDVTVLVTRVGG